MGQLTLSLVALLSFIYGCLAERCGSHLFCFNGCCGRGIFEDCCSSTDNTDYHSYSYSVSTSLSTGIIVAIVISVIIFIAIIVGIVLCCVCCCKAATSTPGTVYTTQPHQVTMVPGTQNTGFAQPPPAYPVQNNAYPMATPMTGYGDPSAASPNTAYPMKQYGNSTTQQKY